MGFDCAASEEVLNTGALTPVLLTFAGDDAIADDMAEAIVVVTLAEALLAQRENVPDRCGIGNGDEGASAGANADVVAVLANQLPENGKAIAAVDEVAHE